MLDQEIAAVSDDGERVTHLHPDSSYQAHLSLYLFAAPFAAGQDVLDAGCGAGYGSDYLAGHGARRVEAIDVSEKAIAFSNRHFQRPNLRYQVMDLERIEGFAPQSFGLIFSSNTLEHVPHADCFLAAAAALLRPEGVAVVAVPPVYHEDSRAANLANPYHLNIWSPRQWAFALGRYFEEVTCIRHHVEVGDRSLNFADSPVAPQYKAEEFVFLPSSVDELCAIGALTAVFLARRPRSPGAIAALGALPMVDDSFTRPAPLPAPAPAPDEAAAENKPHPSWTERWANFRRRLARQK